MLTSREIATLLHSSFPIPIIILAGLSGLLPSCAAQTGTGNGRQRPLQLRCAQSGHHGARSQCCGGGVGGAREDGGERGGRAEAHAHAGVRKAAEGHLPQFLRDAWHACNAARDLRERCEPVAAQLRRGRQAQLRRFTFVPACTDRRSVSASHGNAELSKDASATVTNAGPLQPAEREPRRMCKCIECRPTGRPCDSRGWRGGEAGRHTAEFSRDGLAAAQHERQQIGELLQDANLVVAPRPRWRHQRARRLQRRPARHGRLQRQERMARLHRSSRAFVLEAARSHDRALHRRGEQAEGICGTRAETPQSRRFRAGHAKQHMPPCQTRGNQCRVIGPDLIY